MLSSGSLYFFIQWSVLQHLISLSTDLHFSLLLMNVCLFLCNSELLILLLLLIAMITLLLLLLLLLLMLLMQLTAKVITAVHFQVHVCNTRPFHTMSVCCGAFSLQIEKCLLTCVSTSNIRINKTWFNQKKNYYNFWDSYFNENRIELKL